MSLKVSDDGLTGMAIAITGKESMDSFRELVQRATNLWPDAPQEIKEFADIVTNGGVQQDYREQKKTKSDVPEHLQYVLETNKKSIRYGRCKNCGSHFNVHTFTSGTPVCHYQSEV